MYTVHVGGSEAGREGRVPVRKEREVDTCRKARGKERGRDGYL